MKKEETTKQAVPVMKQLARLMSKEELALISGASTMPCRPGIGGGWPATDTDNID